MQRDDELSSCSEASQSSPLMWVGSWFAAGAGSVVVLATLDAATWVYVVVACVWAATASLWFQRDARRVQGLSRLPVALGLHQAVDAQRFAPVGGDSPWMAWVSGWYWETNAEHALTRLQAGSLHGTAHATDWAALDAWMASSPSLFELWPQPDDTCASDWAKLQFHLKQGQAWSGAIVLPWPAGLQALDVGASAAGRRCALMAHVRRDASGRCLGLAGVLQALPQPDAASGSIAPALLDGAAAETPAGVVSAMDEAEQDALHYALSHDLRAPLRVVEGFTRIVKEDHGRLLDRLGNDHLDRVLAASARMHAMIDAILNQAQLAGVCLERADIDLSALAREVGGELVQLLQCPKPVALRVDDGMQVRADAVLLRRVLENLIGNAIKYSAKVGAPHIEVGVMPATNPAVFFVRDNGAGFDMQHADKLFGLFQRLHSAKDFPGTGVGLAGVQNIIRRHGGRVWAEAQAGQGACFYFTLTDSAQSQSGA